MPTIVSDRPVLERGQKRVTYQVNSDESAIDILSRAAEITETSRDEIYQNLNQLNIQGFIGSNRIRGIYSQNTEFTLDKDFVRYCQTYVRETSQPDPPIVMSDPYYKEKGSCGGTCWRCVTSTPAASLIAWVLLIVGVSACCGSLLVGVRRTRELLEKPNSFLEFSDIVCITVLCGVIFLGLLFFIVATLLSNPNNKAVFNTTTKNTCASVLNIFVIMVLVILFIAWIGAVTVLAVPVIAFTLLHVLYRETGIESIDLRNYGIYEKSYVLSGRQLDTFYDEGLDVFTCYLIALSGAILTLISLCAFLMSAAANSVHLREARYSVFNAYKPDIIGSRISVVDTKM